MVRDDPVEKLQDVYTMWFQFKQSVVDWFQTNGWLIELGVVGFVVFIVVVILVVLILAALLVSISNPTTSQGQPKQGQPNSPPMTVKAYWEEQKKQQEAERRKRFDEEIKLDEETNSPQP